MDINTFEKAEKIVLKMRMVEKEHIRYQEIITGETVVSIETTSGSLVIRDKQRVKDLMALIDGFYFGEGERLRKELDSIS